MQQLLRGQFRRQVGSTLLAQLVSLALIIANSAIIARWLGPAGKGALTLATLAPTVISLMLGLGIGVANAYFAGSRRIETLRLTHGDQKIETIQDQNGCENRLQWQSGESKSTGDQEPVQANDHRRKSDRVRQPDKLIDGQTDDDKKKQGKINRRDILNGKIGEQDEKKRGR